MSSRRRSEQSIAASKYESGFRIQEIKSQMAMQEDVIKKYMARITEASLLEDQINASRARVRKPTAGEDIGESANAKYAQIYNEILQQRIILQRQEVEAIYSARMADRDRIAAAKASVPM